MKIELEKKIHDIDERTLSVENDEQKKRIARRIMEAKQAELERMRKELGPIGGAGHSTSSWFPQVQFILNR